jgi:hypothetical protein
VAIRFADFDWQIARQPVKATPVYTYTDLLKCLSGSSAGSERNIDVKRTGDSGRASDGIAVAAGIGGGGELTVVAQYANLGLLLYLAMGKVTTVAGPPILHTFVAEQTNELPYFTAMKRIGTRYEIYPACKVDSLQLLVSAKDRLVVAKMKFQSAGEVIYRAVKAGPPAIVEATGESSTHRYDWNMAKGAWTVDGSVIGYINEAQVNINNNLQAVDGEGLLPYDLQEGPMDLSVDYKLSVVDWAAYNKQMFGSQAPTEGAVVSGTVPTGAFNSVFTAVADAGAARRALEISAPNLEYRGAVPKIDGDPEGKVVELPLSGRCVQVGAAERLTVKLNNARASYTA